MMYLMSVFPLHIWRQMGASQLEAEGNCCRLMWVELRQPGRGHSTPRFGFKDGALDLVPWAHLVEKRTNKQKEIYSYNLRMRERIVRSSESCP